MPTYSFYCECGVNEDLVVPMGDRDNQVCTCGKTLERKFSVPAIAFRQTGNEMALESLNSKHGGLPKDRFTKEYQQGVVAGLTPPQNRFIGKGCNFKECGN